MLKWARVCLGGELARRSKRGSASKLAGYTMRLIVLECGSPMNPTRQQYLSGVRMAVVKLGTQLLSDAQGQLDTAFIGRMAAQVAEVQKRGVKVTIVSSGAIGAGLRELNLPKRP